MNTKTTLLAASVCALSLALSGCAYDHKDYPRESWFVQPTTVIEADQFKKVEEPLKVSLVVNYLWEGRPIVTEPFDKRPADCGANTTVFGSLPNAILNRQAFSRS